MNQQQACRKAIQLAGGPAALAAKLKTITGKKITRNAISQWERVPDRRVLEVETAIDRQITRHELRPDLYPREGN